VGTARVTLLGEEITLTADAPQEKLEKLGAELETILRRIMEEAGLRGQPTRVALLASINMMEELESVKTELERLKKENEALIGQMVRRIEYALKQE
jgi:cell division protein ZapA (FtsZ GTPase activity inhibitor)